MSNEQDLDSASSSTSVLQRQEPNQDDTDNDIKIENRLQLQSPNIPLEFQVDTVLTSIDNQPAKKKRGRPKTVIEEDGVVQPVTYKVEYEDSTVTLASDKSTSMVCNYNSDKPSCNCFDFGFSLLPCRHILYIRKRQNLVIISRDMVHTRWANMRFANAKFEIRYDQVDCLSYVNLKSIIAESISNKPKTTTINDLNSRFNKCKRIINKIAQLVSGDSEDVFHDRMGQILIIKEMWQKNINFTLKTIKVFTTVDEDNSITNDVSTNYAIETTDDK
ncbi:hypothetical protein BpHYR1_027100 [Brachionus plicatilis]|uniref:SWIM-type domain-containing protein n=1 Tax=Brachionus plicatilis TaxID=10195 RepID=A0A3M7SLG6_BRAPC|nr:hypothetical protein BpHYR1_027100 [Brachionus plicatilis]